MRIYIEGVSVVKDKLDNNFKNYITIKLKNRTIYTDGLWIHSSKYLEKHIYDEIELERGDELTIIGRLGKEYFIAKLRCCSKRSVKLWIGRARIVVGRAKVLHFKSTNPSISGYQVLDR